MTAADLRALGTPLSCLCPLRIEILQSALQLTNDLVGEVWECGTYRAGTTLLMKAHLVQMDSPRLMRTFDTFTGMPVAGPLDSNPIGSFADTSLAAVKALLDPVGDTIIIHAGQMPATFAGLEDSIISVAHIDVDQYESVMECLTFIYPRMQVGGWVVIDDYNCAGCPGAHKAVDEFLADKPEVLRCTLETPQVAFKKV